MRNIFQKERLTRSRQYHKRALYSVTFNGNVRGEIIRLKDGNCSFYFPVDNPAFNPNKVKEGVVFEPKYLWKLVGRFPESQIDSFLKRKTNFILENYPIIFALPDGISDPKLLGIHLARKEELVKKFKGQEISEHQSKLLKIGYVPFGETNWKEAIRKWKKLLREESYLKLWNKCVELKKSKILTIQGNESLVIETIMRGLFFQQDISKSILFKK